MTRKGQINYNVLSYYKKMLDEIRQHKNVQTQFKSEFSQTTTTTDSDDYNILVTNVANALTKEAVDVCRNQTGSRLIEELIDFFNWQQLRILLDAFSVHFELIVVDRFAHRVLQSLIDRFQSLFSDCEDEVQHAEAVACWTPFIDHMHHHYPEYLEHTYGCFAMRSYILMIAGVSLKRKRFADKKQHDSIDKTDALLVKPVITESFRYKVELKDFTARFLLSKHIRGLIDSDVTGPFLQVLMLAVSLRLPKTFKKVCKFLMFESELFSKEEERGDQESAVKIPLIFTEDKPSYFVEQLVALLPEKTLRQFIDTFIAGKERALSVEPKASFILQRVISQVTDFDYLVQLVMTLGSHIPDILSSGQHGIVLNLARRCNQLNSGHADFIRVLLRSLGCNEPSSRQKRFLEALGSLVPFEKLSEDPSLLEKLTIPGCLLIQEMFRFPNPKVLVKCLLGLSDSELVALCKDPRGNHVIEVFLTSADTESRQMFLSRLKGSGSRHFGPHRGPQIQSSLQRYHLGQEHTTLKLPIHCSFKDLPTPGEPSPARTFNFHVPFHILYLQVDFENKERCILKHGTFRLLDSSANFSLGIGENSIVFSVYKRDDKPALPVQLNVRRLERPEASDDPQAHEWKACRLKQECNYIHDDQEHCGLQSQLDTASWFEFLIKFNNLPACTAHNITSGGQWIVPCRSCQLEGSCLWSRSVWHYAHCRIIPPDVNSLREKLRTSQIVFVGDSTLRGLMYTLYSLVNGSLYHWEKSHDSVLLHHEPSQATLAFSYFPQFWLSPDNSPDLTQTLTRVLHRAGVLPSSGRMSKTAIVLGGAQWLTPRMLNQTFQLLQSLGLSHIPVIAKDLSPGFHIRVPGVLFKSRTKDATLSLAKKNKELVETAQQLGFSLLPTFNITSARYREFRPGRCACHFHSVRKDPSLPGAYRIHGDIHAAYSHMLSTVLHDHL